MSLDDGKKSLNLTFIQRINKAQNDLGFAKTNQIRQQLQMNHRIKFLV